jgi:pimeloyl-ACP methyl ester carboxylesterase
MELFFRKTGKGYPIIILHGLYGMSDNWFSIAGLLSAKAEVWLPDLRNHGRSPHSEVHSYKAMSDDMLEFIQSHAIHKPILIGHSMGGKVAMTLAKNHPELISALCVVDIAPKDYAIDHTIDFHSHKHIIDSLCSLNLSNIHSREEADLQLKEKIPSDRLRAFLLKNLQRNQKKTFQWLFNLPVLKKSLSYIAGGFGNDWDNIVISGFPVLFLKGEKSNYILSEDFPLIEKIFPAAIIETIPNAGHWLHAENPELVVELVEKFTIQ